MNSKYIRRKNNNNFLDNLVNAIQILKNYNKIKFLNVYLFIITFILEEE